MRDQYDVVILGGGLAGLSLARQLKQVGPAISVFVADRRSYPVPEAAHKVGESTVEVGAHYFRDVLKVEEHLVKDQLFKSGLRFYYTAGDNTAIEERYEFGASMFPPVRTYQLDRGRFENKLASDNLALGIDFLDACKVESVSLDSARHTARFIRNGESFTVSGRWLVDASGRGAVLKRHLGLQKSNNHAVNAAWFRIAEPIDIDDWSKDDDWRNRCPPGFRRLGTNHLMGRGYWAWVIPLASDSTSFGIVADPAVHDFSEFNTFERAMKWLWKYEPQCAKSVEEHRDKLMDFLVLNHFSHGCKKTFSGERWALTGEAGVFLDPFYSPGSDFIGLSNTIICDLIFRSLAGEDVTARAEVQSQLYQTWFESFLEIYDGQYPVMGNARVMTTKIIWDYAVYWAGLALLYFQKKVCDLEFVASVASDLSCMKELHHRMQVLFRDWDASEESDKSAGFVDCLKIGFLYELHVGLVAKLNNEQLREKISENRQLLEALAATIFSKAAETLFMSVDPLTVDPYSISLRSEQWQEQLQGSTSKVRIRGDFVAHVRSMWPDGSCAAARVATARQ